MGWTTTCQITGCTSLQRSAGAVGTREWGRQAHTHAQQLPSQQKQGWMLICLAWIQSHQLLIVVVLPGNCQPTTLSCCCFCLPPPLLQIWNCSQDESNRIVHEFFESDHFNDGIPIIPGQQHEHTSMHGSSKEECD